MEADKKFGKCSLTFLTKYIQQLETNIQNYAVPSLYPSRTSVVEENVEELDEEEKEIVEVCPQLIPFQKCKPVDPPRICLWFFMEKDDLEHYVGLTTKCKMREVLDKKFGMKIKGFSRIILIEFIIDVTLFCVNSRFNLEQISAILGIYYLTHKYFTDHLYVCPEDVLTVFKDFLMYHSFLFPPTRIKLFNIEECKGLLIQFASLYLRHMPLIRMLSLPNFGFELEYELEPEEKSDGKKGKKKKGKKEKHGKKKKKGGKKGKHK